MAELTKKSAAEPLRFALAGNPNCGKTTLFNSLTGSSQYVGNWPGVTVEKKEGYVKFSVRPILLLDLPGIYSLSPYSPEEMVTRSCLVGERPDLIINILDAVNLERNLYLTTQLAELGIPMLIALNMVDLLEKRGERINYVLLEKELGIPVVAISAGKGLGLEDLVKRAVFLAEKNSEVSVKNFYPPEIDRLLGKIEEILSEGGTPLKVHKRWLAVKIFEEDSVVKSDLGLTQAQARKISLLLSGFPASRSQEREMIIADRRYQAICEICARTVKKGARQGEETVSEKIDALVTHRIFAIPFFLILMLLVFYLTFGPLGTFFSEKMGLINGTFSVLVNRFLLSLNASEWARSMVIDGVIAGIGSVAAFLPQLLLLFLLLSVLEDSGYMARAAFIMDRLLRKVGLSGKAFVPMLMGFGCTVPAVLGTRTLESEKSKRLTVLITPFMSCSAKMPLYTLLISAFFTKSRPLILFAVYGIGVMLAILTALLFKNTVLKGEDIPFVMELPPYRLPTLKSLWLHVWERLKDFLIKAGTVLFGATVIIWFLQSFNLRFELAKNSSESILAQIGTALAPLFRLCGFGDWRASVSLLAGLAAKESVVSTMGILYNAGGQISLAGALTQIFTPLSAFSFMAFVLLYTPCIAALSAIHKEMGSLKWTVIAAGYQFLAAWFVSAFIFQMGTLIARLL